MQQFGLERFRLHIERRDTPAPPGVNVEMASTTDSIAAIFFRDTRRQKADSMFFNRGLSKRYAEVLSHARWSQASLSQAGSSFTVTARQV
jgi:hypothetical protein